MMCANPYLRNPFGVKPKDRSNHIVRQDSTPFPCGQCLSCRINKAREWKIRILLEQTVHKTSAFVTLTYDDESLPRFNSLEPFHLTKFFKDFRYRYGKFRYFAVGEYGEDGVRGYNPHYHAILYGEEPFIDDDVRRIWKRGLTQTAELNDKTAAYIAGYTTKKFGKKDDANLGNRYPTFTRSSKLDGGIGYPAIKKMAKNLTRNKYYEAVITRQIRFQGKMFPLGRYIIDKLNKELGIDPEQIRKDYYEYQIANFEKHGYGPGFKRSITDEHRVKRLSQEKRHKIFSNRKAKKMEKPK